MLDFVFNLLIFFIITTSFVREAGVTVIRPEAGTAVHDASGNILIAIRPNGEIWMDRREVDLREVRPLIERLHIERPEDTVVVDRGQIGEGRAGRPGDGRGRARRHQGGRRRRRKHQGGRAWRRCDFRSPRCCRR